MLANYLIGLREGLEASLVVSILATFLVKSGHRDRLRYLWIGVGAALAAAVAGWALLQFITALTARSFTAQETIGGAVSSLALGFVTWIIFSMRKASRALKKEATHRLDRLLLVVSRSVALRS